MRKIFICISWIALVISIVIVSRNQLFAIYIGGFIGLIGIFKQEYFFNKMIVWFVRLMVFILCGFIFYGINGGIFGGGLYLIINFIIFFGIVLGIIACILYKFKGLNKLTKSLFEMSINQKHNLPQILLFYAVALFNEENDIKQIDKALALFETLGESYDVLAKKYSFTYRALCYWRKNEIDKAILILIEEIKEFEYISADIYALLGSLYILKEDYNKALNYTNKALEEDNNHSLSFDNLGQIYLRLNDIEKAKIYFKKAIQTKETLVDSQYNLGVILEGENNIEEAKKCFEKAYFCNITPYNIVTHKQIEDKYNKYFKENL